jgi:hypothetical protein
MFLVIQAPVFQMDAYVLNLGGSSLESRLSAQKKMVSRKTVNYWETGKAAQYDLDCTIQVLQVYPTVDGVSGVPSKVALLVRGTTYTLASISKTLPALITAGGSGYESPATVSYLDASGTQQYATGVIEWVPGNMYPTAQDVLKETGVSTAILKAGDPNPVAQTFVALFIIFCVLFITSVVLVAVFSSKKTN